MKRERKRLCLRLPFGKLEHAAHSQAIIYPRPQQSFRLLVDIVWYGMLLCGIKLVLSVVKMKMETDSKYAVAQRV